MIASTIAPTDLESLYAFGYGYLAAGKAKDAAEVFGVLTVYAPFEARYWCALGASAHAGGNVEAAAMAYGVAGHIDPSDARTAGNRAELLLLGGRVEEARHVLRLADLDGTDEAQKRGRALLRASEQGSAP
jgi:Flp pilus assembly protein TadD